MKKISTLKWLVVVFFLSVISFSFLADKNNTNSLTQGIQFCPAFPGKIVYTNPDGSKITIFLKGDEWLHWAKSIDGYTLVQDEQGTYFYAEQDASGNLVPSNIKANDPGSRNESELQFLVSTPKELTVSTKQAQSVEEEKLKASQSSFSQKSFPKAGVMKVLMILMDFQDVPFTHTKTEFEDMMNQENYNGTGSFRDYYLSMSYGALDLQTTVTNIYHASGTMAKYGANIGSSKYINPRQFVQEAVDAAYADGIDFSQFDNDGDGVCDGVIVVHAGYGEEAGASSNTIWSHKWSLGAFARTYNGVLVNTYNIDPELSGASGTGMTNIGVICHEFGHALGLPDLYDVDYSGAFDAGYWDLMASGSWNNNGVTPSSLSVWCKAYLGWSNPTVIETPETGKTLNESITHNTFYRVNTTTENEYFLLENRQQNSWDKYIPYHGLLIWHIDDNWNATHHAVNDLSSHQGVDLEEADNIKTSATVTGDPFPGTASKTSFTDVTVPSSKSWANTKTWKPISTIAENSGVITFDFMQGLPAIDAKVTGIVAPAGNACGFSSSETITVNIKNNGSTDITTGTISYQINSLAAVTETFNTTIAAGATLPYSFTTKADLSAAGQFTIKATVAVTSDGNADNNVYSKLFINFPTASSSIPFTQDFEGTFLPTNWTIYNPDNAATWAQASVAGNGTSTKAAKMDCWNYDVIGQRDGLITPKIDLTSASNPTLTFKVAYHKTNVDGLGVYVSNDCGVTFTQVYYKEGDELQTTSNYDTGLGMTPAAADEWRLETIDLTSYAGSNVFIKFESLNGYGDNIYIDDVNVAEPACVAPTTQATGFGSSNIDLTSLTASWTRGNGAGVIVVYKEGSEVNFTPVSGTDYTSQVGTDLGSGNILAYLGTGTSVDLTGLTANKTYYFSVFEYSAANCFKTPALTGTASTLGLPVVVTKSVTNIAILGATITGDVTSQGGDVVTETGFVWNTAGSATLSDNYIAVGSGTGSFQQAISLSSLATYYVRAYATNSYGTAYGNELSFTPMGGCDNIIYAAILGQVVSGTYTDLGSNGTPISVANNDDANSSAIDIGFPFTFNCITADKFILNTNGFIKLGDVAPTSTLYYTAYNGSTGGPFNSTSLSDINLICPFNHDLTAGSGTPEFRVYTQGTTPNRVTTIQFKNLSDKEVTDGPVQFTNMSFQIKLYETTNVIEFIYGTFTPSGNAATFKTGAVGLKGFSVGTANTTTITKGSATAWNSASYLDGNYTGNAFNFKNSVVPTSGLTYRFTPRQPHDIAVKEIYTMGQLPLTLAAPHVISAAISNEGTDEQTNVEVTLAITGANTFTPAVVTIPSLKAGEVKVVDFAEFTPSATGSNSITVSVASDDVASNNSKAFTQIVTNNTFCYADPATSAASAYSGTFIGACKYHINGSAYITTVDAQILNNSVMTGLTTTAYVMDASGAIIGQSNQFTVASGNLGNWVSFNIITPPLVTDADYYVGLLCASGKYFAAYQNESPTRTGAYFTIPVGGGTPAEFGNNARLMYRAIAKYVATVNITNLSQTADGTQKPVTVTTTPTGLTVNVTYNGSATAPTASGDYSVVATVNDASYWGTATATLHIAPGTGVDPNDMNSIQIYSDTKDIYVKIPTLSKDTRVVVYNIIGEQVCQNTNLTIGVNRIEGNYHSGTYIVRVISNNKVVTQKVAIQR